VIEYTLFMVSVAEWIRHLVVAQEIVGSNPITHPIFGPSFQEGLLIIPRLQKKSNFISYTPRSLNSTRWHNAAARTGIGLTHR
jgi:hypothetical protein